MIEVHKPSITIGVDGAIGFEQIKSLDELNVNHFVLGTSALFNGDLAYKAREINNFKAQLGVTA
jgi:pentose-5-phosphate-3-epimerase